MKIAAVHDHVHSILKGLYSDYCAPEVEQGVGVCDLVRHHRPCQDHCLFHCRLSEDACSLDHRVGSMGNHYPFFRGFSAGFQDFQPVRHVHIEAVDELVYLEFDRQCTSNIFQYLWKMGIFETEFSFNLVILLIERATCYYYSYLHGTYLDEMLCAPYPGPRDKLSAPCTGDENYTAEMSEGQGRESCAVLKKVKIPVLDIRTYR